MKLGCTKWGLILAVYALSGCSATGAIELLLLVGELSGDSPSASIPYYRQAEKEIKSGTYDPDLWAEALVLVEGDEEKRYDKYIVLRVEQLYLENEGLESESSLIEPLVFSTKISETTISGIYVSDIQRGPPWMFLDRQPRFTFEQNGNDIIGTDVSKNGSKIYGIRNGDTIKFKYWGVSNSLILGEWKINPDGTGLEGTWETDIEHGSWNLTRIE